MAQPTATFKLGASLNALVKACEKLCVAECCGIDAFDFSPLHMASHLSAHTGAISEADLEAIEKEIDALAASANQRLPDENGHVGSIEGTNQYFTKEDLEKLIHQLRANLRLAPKVLEYSDRLQEDGGL
jgi:hypothetical protein